MSKNTFKSVKDEERYLSSFDFLLYFWETRLKIVCQEKLCLSLILLTLSQDIL